MKKILTLVLLVISLLTIAVTGHAEDRWKWIASTDTVSMYLDTQTITQSGPNNILVWIKHQYAYPKENGSTYVLGRENFNIKDYTYLLVYAAEYAADGHVVLSGSTHLFMGWIPYAGTYAEDELKAALEYLNSHKAINKK